MGILYNKYVISVNAVFFLFVNRGNNEKNGVGFLCEII